MCGLHDPKSGGDVTCQGSCVVLHKEKKCTKHLEWEFLTHSKNPINGFHMILWVNTVQALMNSFLIKKM